jgi:hypothetical protein
MTLTPTDPLPDLALIDTHARRVPLSTLVGEETLIVFLRHLT